MAFHEVLFSTGISNGAVGHWAGFEASLAEKDSGDEKRNEIWQDAIGEWDVVQGVRTQSQLDTLGAFFANRKGIVFPFRFRPPEDYTLDRQTIGTTDSSTAIYQVFKRYTDAGGFDFDRNIFKILLGAESVWHDGNVIDEGAGASQYQLNDNTGLLTLGSTLAATSGDLVEIALTEFHEPVRFMTKRMQVTTISPGDDLEKLYDWPINVKTVRDIV